MVQRETTSRGKYRLKKLRASTSTFRLHDKKYGGNEAQTVRYCQCGL